MNKELEDALSAYQDVSQHVARLHLEIDGLDSRMGELSIELSEAKKRYADAKKRLLMLASDGGVVD